MRWQKDETNSLLSFHGLGVSGYNDSIRHVDVAEFDTFEWHNIKYCVIKELLERGPLIVMALLF